MYIKPRNESWLWLTFLFIVITALAACQRGQSNDIPEIEIELSLSPDPPEVGLSTVSLWLNNAAGQAITGAEIELEGNMNHAGMTPVFSQMTGEGAGPLRGAAQLYHGR